MNEAYIEVNLLFDGFLCSQHKTKPPPTLYTGVTPLDESPVRFGQHQSCALIVHRYSLFHTSRVVNGSLAVNTLAIIRHFKGSAQISDVLPLAQPAILRRGHPDLALKRLAKGGLRLITEQPCNRLHAHLVLQQARRPQHPPAGQVGQRWLADQFGETGGEGRARKRHGLC